MTRIDPISIYQQKINQINNRINARLSAAGLEVTFPEVLKNVESTNTQSDRAETPLSSTASSVGTAVSSYVQDASKKLGISQSLLGQQALSALKGSSYDDTGLLSSNNMYSYLGQQALSALTGSSYGSYADTGILSANTVYPSAGGIFTMNSINPNAPIGKRTEYEYLIGKAAEKYGVSDILIKAIMKAESDFNPESTSGAGAAGLMQLMPATAKLMGVSDIYDPEENINGGVGYFRQQLDAFGGDVKMALAAYNCGPTKLRNLGVKNLDNPSDFAKLPKETQNYVTKIINSLK